MRLDRARQRDLGGGAETRRRRIVEDREVEARERLGGQLGERLQRGDHPVVRHAGTVPGRVHAGQHRGVRRLGPGRSRVVPRPYLGLRSEAVEVGTLDVTGSETVDLGAEVVDRDEQHIPPTTIARFCGCRPASD